MNLPQYPIFSDETFHSYQFTSVGPKGTILKGIQFVKLSDTPTVYNLVLGDLDPVTRKLNDLAITDNKDPEVVLATVGAAVIDFCNHFPGASVFAEGNTLAKKRLYQMTISSHLPEIKVNFLVFGLSGGKWERFTKNRRYQALLVKPV